MITQECQLYVLNKGFTHLEDLSPGDKVYTLDGFDVKVTVIDSVRSEFISQRINRIDAGTHNVLITDDALTLYYSELYGFKYLYFNEIPGHTRDKTYAANKYLPVLSWVAPGARNRSNAELEYIARSVLVNECDIKSFTEIIEHCSGLDCLALVDFLEFWCSASPGRGWLDKARVKSRVHAVNSQYITDELAKVAVLAGYTSSIAKFDERKWALKVNYEPMPIPGSRPKIEKYYYHMYTGMAYNVNAANLPILGLSRGRVFYLPTRSDTIS
jgi:hypothetical protein